MRRSLLSLLAAFSLAPWALAAGAAEAPPAVDQVAHELAGIRTALDTLVTLAGRTSSNDHTQLLMRRLEVAVARLAPDEQALNRQREKVEDATEAVDQYKSMREVWEAQMTDEGEAGERMSESERRRQLESFEAQLEQMEQRRFKAEQRLLTLDANLEQKRVLIGALEAEIDRRLGLE